MEKMLSKSKSRFFGKKKSTKNLGISSSDPPGTDSERKNESFGGSSARPMPSISTPRIVPGGMPNGPRLHHAGSSNMGSECPTGFHSLENLSPPFARPANHNSQSRFEVHISPTAFSPIVIPSSATPPESLESPSKQRGLSTPAGKSNAVSAERTPRSADGPVHGRSQSSSVAPEQTPNSRSRSRRHGIPANFFESVGAAASGTKAHWNGQSLGAEHLMNSQTPHDRSPSSFPSQNTLVHPSASAPVTSCLSGADTGLAFPGLAPIHESVTVPPTFPSSLDSSGPTPLALPRSSPSYNLTALTPISSTVAPPGRNPEVDPHVAPKSTRSALPQPPTHRPHRGLAPSSSPPSSSSTRQHENATTPHQPYAHNHRNASPRQSSETEIGYKGLSFPLPPSSEEGLATSFSSSQSSLFSVTSGRRSGDRPTTPKKMREGRSRGEGDRTPGDTESRGKDPGSGRGVRDRGAADDGRASPTLSLRTMRNRREGPNEHLERDPPHMDRTDPDPNAAERDTLRHVQDRVAKELEDVLGVATKREEHPAFSGTSRIRAASEAPAPRPHPVGARGPKQPEPTKPLVLNPARKTLHTVRSFTTLAERKPLQASSSNRDLSASFHGVGERGRAVTAIPVRVGRERDGPGPDCAGQSSAQASSGVDEQPQIPPSHPLPTPPNSSSALSFLANETKGEKTPPSSRPHADRGKAPGPMTLEDVTSALQAQRARFDELAGYVLGVAQQHAAEKAAYAGRVGCLEGTVAKMEHEIRGLRWLVLENSRARGGGPRGKSEDAKELDAEITLKLEGGEKKLRRSSTMPHLPTLGPGPGARSGPPQPRNKRFGGLGLDFSPDSAASSSLFTLSPLAVSSRIGVGDEERTPSMDEIIDRLMAVRQWAGADVRVSVVEGAGESGSGGEKRIVFREV